MAIPGATSAAIFAAGIPMFRKSSTIKTSRRLDREAYEKKLG